MKVARQFVHFQRTVKSARIRLPVHLYLSGEKAGKSNMRRCQPTVSVVLQSCVHSTRVDREWRGAAAESFGSLTVDHGMPSAVEATFRTTCLPLAAFHYEISHSEMRQERETTKNVPFHGIRIRHIEHVRADH